jgi:hypothetical protein
MLLDVRLDPERVGGCAIAWNGIYRDYSLRRYMVEKRADIAQIVSEYAKKSA